MVWLRGHFRKWRREGHLLIRRRWFYVFYCLLSLLIFYPFLENRNTQEPSRFLTFMTSVIAVAIIWAVSFRPQQFFIALLLGVPAMIFSWFRCYTVECSHMIPLFAAVFTFFLYLYAIWLLAWDHVSAFEITTNELYAVACLYLLVTLAFASLFEVVEILHPGSFRVVAPGMAPFVGWSELFFLSFCTISTLGYGDIIPFTQHARSLALLEVFIGVIFIAVVFARAISLSTTRAFLRREEPFKIEIDEPSDKSGTRRG